MKLIELLKVGFRESWAWLLFNVLGLVAYVAVEFGMLIPRFPEDGPTGIEQTFLWLDLEYPLLAFYLGMNVMWLLMKGRKALSQPGLFALWTLVGLAWGATLVCDPVSMKELAIMRNMVGGN
jgi:hypothetical protein